jgi:serine/threonine-protein kinase
MSVAAGSRLGPYEIVAPLGAGGMGEVYKARDTRLDRIVAVKMLLPAVTAQPAFQERFDREARAISRLNHPHICTLHDVGEADGVRYLVLEYLEGETLADRLARGPLPLPETLTVGAQICDALALAHRQGIVHRDLKPGNVMLTRSGAKLLDFGLAKPAASAVTAGATVTVSAPLTSEGALLGTLPYMAPEQVEGKEADARADIFALGAVLHEMASGRRAFDGKTAASVIAAILERRPPPLSSLQPLTPPALDHIVTRCLAKDPEERWQNASDVMRELTWVRDSGQSALAGAAPPSPWRVRSMTAAGLVAAAALGAVASRLTLPTPSIERGVQHFDIAVPDGYSIPPALASQLALSRDGSLVVFAARVADEAESVDQIARVDQLFVKRTDAAQAAPVPDAERGHSPFLSPDASWVGFIRDGDMFKAPLHGGAVVSLAPAGGFSGASWGDDGFIVYSPTHGGGIWRVSENGGQPQQLTRPDAQRGERGHHQPFVLPGSKAFLFTIELAGRSHDDARIAAQMIGETGHRTVLDGGMAARYVQSGHIVYGRAGQLLSVPFDPVRLQTSGPPSVVLTGVRTHPGSGAGEFSLADNGALAYVPGGSVERRQPLQWVGRDGTVTRVAIPEAAYEHPRLSPSLNRAVVTVSGADDDVWIVDLARNSRQRVTTTGDNLTPQWFPSGDRLALTVDVDNRPGLHALSVSGSAGPERLTDDGFPTPSSVSPDGSVLAYSDSRPESGLDIWTFTIAGRARRALVQTRFDEYAATFSPDGRWIAYVSLETGRQEVVIAHYPDLAHKTTASIDGGSEPVWAKSGDELFYRQGANMMAVAVSFTPSLKVGAPKLLFRTRSQPTSFGNANYDVAPDGTRFLMIGMDPSSNALSRLGYVLGWASTLPPSR